MLKSKELRAKAWASLQGKFGIALLATIVSGLLISIGQAFVGVAGELTGILEQVQGVELTELEIMGAGVIVSAALAMSFLGFLAFVFIQAPALIGCCKYFIVNTEAKPKVSEVFSGFTTSYARNIGTMLLLDIKIFLWTLLFVIPGLIKSFEYAVIPYILADNPEIKSKDAFKQAKEMMRGNKWRLFKLNFSFIGWMLLAIVVGTVATLINSYVGVVVCVVVGLLITPYVDAANAEFYVELKNK